LGVNGGIFRHSFLTVRQAKTNLQKQTPLPSRPLLFHMRSNADVAPSASAQVVRGAVAASMVAFGGSFFARQIAPIGRFLRRADPPAVRSPAPTGSAAPGRHGVPFPAFVLLSPVLPLHASGWHPLRRGGGGRRLTLHLSVIYFGCHPHACAQGVFKFLSADRKPTP